MKHQAHELAQIGLPAKINYPVQFRMMMPELTDLDELDFASEVVNNGLVAFCLPPFNVHIVFSAGIDDPKWRRLAGQLVDLRVPAFLARRQVNVTPECCRANRQFKLLVEKLDEAV